MKLKKVSLLGLSLLLSFSVVACARKTPGTVGENVNYRSNVNTRSNANTRGNVVTKADDYTNYYSTAYNAYSTGLDKYSMYDSVANISKVYETKDYPGNEKYLKEVKAAYKETRDKTKHFVDSLKKDAKTEDTELKGMHDNLIVEGERCINEMDARIKKLNEISDADMKKDQNAFISTVHGITHTGNTVGTTFKNSITDMNKRLGITK